MLVSVINKFGWTVCGGLSVHLARTSCCGGSVTGFDWETTKWLARCQEILADRSNDLVMIQAYCDNLVLSTTLSHVLIGCPWFSLALWFGVYVTQKTHTTWRDMRGEVFENSIMRYIQWGGLFTLYIPRLYIAHIRLDLKLQTASLVMRIWLLV